jgi:hypothetical protein
MAGSTEHRVIPRQRSKRSLSGAKRTSAGAAEVTLLTQCNPAVRCKRMVSVLHQCIRPLIGALLLTIMDISAHAISLAESPRRTIWVTSVRKHRERPNLHLAFILSQTSAG